MLLNLQRNDVQRNNREAISFLCILPENGCKDLLKHVGIKTYQAKTDFCGCKMNILV